MYCNYHTHTVRCNHATGTEREYIEAALAAGMPVLGFSDHVPYPFPDDYYSSFRMTPAQLPDYMDTLLRLREEYAGRIDILIGFEAEYYPAFFDKLLKLLAPYPYDYLILGQHFIDNEITHVYSGQHTTDPELLRRYVDQVIEGLQTGKYSCLAHPDLMDFVGDPARYDQECLRLCRAAKQLGIPLEINLLGIREERPYPHKAFFRIAAQVGNDVIIASDAHSPDVVFDRASCEVARAWVREMGLRLIDRLPIRSPRA